MRSNLTEGGGATSLDSGRRASASSYQSQTQVRPRPICLLKDDPNQCFQLGILGALSPPVQKVPQKRKGGGKGKVL